MPYGADEVEDWAGSEPAPASEEDEAVAVIGADLDEDAGCRGLPRGAGPLPAGMASGGSAVCCKDSVDDLSADITLPCDRSTDSDADYPMLA